MPSKRPASLEESIEKEEDLSASKRMRGSLRGSLSKSSSSSARSKRDFSITLSCVYSFKEMLRNLHNVLVRLSMQVVSRSTSGGEFEGIRVNAMTSNKSCVCTARYACSVDLGVASDQPYTVCVDLKTLHEIFKKISNQSVVTIRRQNKCSDLEIEYSDSLGMHSFFLRTYLDTEDPVELKNLPTEHSLQVGVETLRSFVKQSKALRASGICISILRRQDLEEDAPESQSESQSTTSYVELSYEGESASCRRLFATTQRSQEDPNMELTSVSCGQRRGEGARLMLPLFSKTFDNAHLGLFLKSMEKDKHVTLSCGNASPLVVSYSLGFDSHIRFVLAQQISES